MVPVNNSPVTIARRGLMLVISSPSGAGKSTIARNLLEKDKNISLSVSVTTRVDLLGLGLKVLDDFSNGQIDTALEVHRVHAGSNCLCTFANDGLGQNRCGGGAVTGDVVGLGGNFANELCAHVLELVFQFDFLGDGNAVLGDARSAEGLVDNDVTALRAEGYFHCIGKNVDALEHLFAR